MSSKLNFWEIVSGHYATLKTSQGKTSWIDLFTFYVLPLSCAGLFVIFSMNLEADLTSLLVNFGSIFTALLLSVLVLVYDQGTKLESNGSNEPLLSVKKELLRELYYNISYSILLSIFLVVLCFIHTVAGSSVVLHEIAGTSFEVNYGLYLTTPLIILVSINLILTTIMIVKRMHTLLTT
jgi:hypothetical protein